jgi:hypothetical protein
MVLFNDVVEILIVLDANILPLGILASQESTPRDFETPKNLSAS